MDITPGLTGDLALGLSGLTPFELLADAGQPRRRSLGRREVGRREQDVSWIVNVPEGTTLSRFDLDSSDDKGSDLDLTVYRVVSRTTCSTTSAGPRRPARRTSRSRSRRRRPGTYLVVANIYSTTGPMTWDMTYANVLPDGEGDLTATPNPLAAVRGKQMSYDLS